MKDRSPAFWWSAVGIAVVAAGLVGPWANALGLVSRSGLDTSDGKIIAVLAVIAAITLLSNDPTRGRAGWGVILGIAICGFAIIDLTDIQSKTSDPELGGLVEVGWGVYATIFGGAAYALGMVGLYKALPPSPDIAPKQAA